MRLLVLSGCSTARSVGAASDGRASLPRAAWIAGARSTLATLWDVRDDEMPDVMSDFYDA